MTPSPTIEVLRDGLVCPWDGKAFDVTGVGTSLLISLRLKCADGVAFWRVDDIDSATSWWPIHFGSPLAYVQMHTPPRRTSFSDLPYPILVRSEVSGGPGADGRVGGSLTADFFITGDAR